MDSNIVDFTMKKKLKSNKKQLDKLVAFASSIDQAVLWAVTADGLKPEEILFVLANRLGAVGVTEFLANDKLETFEQAIQIALKKYEEGIFKTIK